MKYIKRIINLDRSEWIAFYYYFFTSKQLKSTHFIDEVSTSYGYGKLMGSIGVWEYQLPFWFKK